MAKIFIDGSAGTTGLKIVQRLSADKSLELVILEGDERKDPEARKKALNSCDIAFLCLPDQAARESVSLIENPEVRVIDTSTAHRTEPGWTYGFPELKWQRDKIFSSKRVANPGCHASGFISLIRPLTGCGIIKPETFLSATSITGYSGGGKKMIADYENPELKDSLATPRLYGLTQEHKHLKEMVKVTGLTVNPAFLPIVSPFYSGMTVMVPLNGKDIGVTIDEVRDVLREYYKDCELIKYMGDRSEEGFLSTGGISGSDRMEIYVYGNNDRIVLVSRFDNLGKGASGAAIQNMNIMLGRAETTGLVI